MDFERAVRRLQDRLQEPLPGLAAHKLMAPHGRIPDTYHPDPPGARQSGVLVLLVPGPGVVFIRRCDDGGHHAGQIAFPGGGMEPGDLDLAATAVRETEEEIGVCAASIEVIGQLSRLYIPVSNYSVLPVVGVLPTVPAFIPEPGEVDEVMVLPIKGFADARKDLRFDRHGRNFVAPAFVFDGVTVWGATAMMFAEFLKIWGEVATR
jgi:8-oxo-dGTP pyrophosphatase MutT (NUDIX family)